MRIHVLRREQRLEHPIDEVFAFFSDARNLQAITPALLRFRIVTPEPLQLRRGAFVQYRLHLHGVPLAWHTLIEDWSPPRRFVDAQVRGPFALWHHMHEFAPAGRAATVMTDTVRYAIGLGPLGELAHRAVVGRDLRAIFDHRAAAVPALLASGGQAVLGGVEPVEDEVDAGQVAR